METRVDVDEAKTSLSRPIEQALAGDDVVNMRSGRSLVRLVPVEQAPARRVVGTSKGDFIVPDDFDEALNDEVVREFEN